jgi:hypothetical protein
MYLHLGQSVMVPYDAIVGIFDLDNTSYSPRTRRFLEQAEREGRMVVVGDDLPKSFVLCQEGDGAVTVYVSQLNTATLLRRAESEVGYET